MPEAPCRGPEEEHVMATVREILARQEVEELAKQIDWDRARKLRPPQEWFDGQEPSPFEPEGQVSSALLLFPVQLT